LERHLAFELASRHSGEPAWRAGKGGIEKLELPAPVADIATGLAALAGRVLFHGLESRSAAIAQTLFGESRLKLGTWQPYLL
jgi:hypothetical protein